MSSSKPFAPKKSLEIKGRRMAFIDEGQGAPIIFLGLKAPQCKPV
jgi:haloalkane dehalogenase